MLIEKDWVHFGYPFAHQLGNEISKKKIDQEPAPTFLQVIGDNIHLFIFFSL